MRNVEELYQEVYVQIGRMEIALEFYTGPTNTSLPNNDELIDFCKKCIDKLNKLCDILNVYHQLEEEGLFGEFTLEYITDIKNFCASEKERYTEIIVNSTDYINIIPNNDIMVVFQEAEIYLNRLITLNS